jgi:hypothetical protein
MNLKEHHIAAIGVGISAVAALVAIYYYKTNSAAQAQAGTDNSALGSFPYFQTAALPSSVSASPGASGGVPFDPTALTKGISDAMASALAALQSSSPNPVSDTGAALINQLATGLLSKDNITGANYIQGEYQVIGGQEVFQLQTGQVAGVLPLIAPITGAPSPSAASAYVTLQAKGASGALVSTQKVAVKGQPSAQTLYVQAITALPKAA